MIPVTLIFGRNRRNMTSLSRHLWPKYNTLDFKILTQCVKLLGERVLQVWWWYLHWFRRYRKKTRGGLEIAPPSGARVKFIGNMAETQNRDANHLGTMAGKYSRVVQKGGKKRLFGNPQVLLPKFVTCHEKHFLWKFHQNRSTLEPGLRGQKFVQKGRRVSWPFAGGLEWYLWLGCGEWKSECLFKRLVECVRCALSPEICHSSPPSLSLVRRLSRAAAADMWARLCVPRVAPLPHWNGQERVPASA